MDRDVLFGVLDELARARRAGESSGGRLAQTCVEVLDVTGAGIMLMIDDGHRGTLGASDHAIGLVEELQFTLGIGPCIDTCRTGIPVLEPDLAHSAGDRWPELTHLVVKAGVAAIFGFPIRIAGLGLGALDLYRNTTGDLRAEQHADALIMADVIAREILDWQAAAPPGGLALQLDQPERFRYVVHQATGMLSVILDIPVADALIRLRAYAYAEGRTVGAVADDVVHHQLLIE